MPSPPTSTAPVPPTTTSAAPSPTSAAAPIAGPPDAELLHTKQELNAAKVEIANLKIERRKLSDELHGARAQSDTQAKTLNVLRERITELEAKAGQVTALRARVAELEESTARMQELEFRIEDLTEKLAERESLVGTLQSQLVTLPPASAGAHDDLTNIKGIGPKTERALRALGITTYRQIAEWTSADIDLFAGKLKLKAERIVRDDWVGRARKLLGG